MAPPSERTICALAEVMTPSLQGDEAKLARVYSTFLYTFGDLPADSGRVHRSPLPHSHGHLLRAHDVGRHRVFGADGG